MVNQDEFIKIMHDKLTQHESISVQKKIKGLYHL
jgi:hypothetical protein